VVGDTVADVLQVLCLSRDPTIGAGVAAMLASLADFTVATRTTGYDDGVRDARTPDVAIVVLGDDPGMGLTVVETLRAAARVTYIVAVSADDDAETIVRAMRAGADEHLSLPLSQQDLLKVCIKVAELRRGGGTKPSRGGELWVAFGAKGGLGVTTLVVNLAVALRAAGRDVALVDLDVHAGDVASFLDLQATYSLHDVMKNIRRLDTVLLQGTMLRHASGVHVLAAPSVGHAEPPLEITAEQALAILELVASTHEVTLVDTPGILCDSVRGALTAADRILLVTDLTVPALRGCARTIEWLRDQDVDPESHVEVVVNRYANRSGEIAPAEAARTLGLPIRALLPRDDTAGLSAANAGKPLAELPEGAALQRAIAALAGRTPGSDDPNRRRGVLLRLFSGAARP
jgi:pilus assembly protein CpaE